MAANPLSSFIFRTLFSSYTLPSIRGHGDTEVVKITKRKERKGGKNILQYRSRFLPAIELHRMEKVEF